MSHSCKEDTVVDVSKGAKPIKSHSSAYNRGTPLQRMYSDGKIDGSIPSTPRLEDELKPTTNVQVFTYNELKIVTRNFRPDSALGEGGFGVVYKGWIDKIESTGVKVAFGITVAAKVLNQEGQEGHRRQETDQHISGLAKEKLKATTTIEVAAIRFPQGE